MLDLRTIGTVIWATGYGPDFDFVRLPFTDASGYPIQRRGVTEIPGLYVLGLHWLYKAKSGIFAGIDDDASYLASVIADRHPAARAKSRPVRAT
jgi:putative flavoprotein involved in K+ transport